MDGSAFISPPKARGTHGCCRVGLEFRFIKKHSHCTDIYILYTRCTHTHLNNSLNVLSSLEHIHIDVHVRVLSALHLWPSDE